MRRDTVNNTTVSAAAPNSVCEVSRPVNASAGTVTASLTGGVLALTGDDLPNVLTVKVEAAQVTLTPDATTDVGNGAGNPRVLPGAAKSIKAVLKGGNDSITLDGAANCLLTGSASFDLGYGDNVLNLSTTGKISLGGLTVKAADGNDTITVRGGTGQGSTIASGASFLLGNGGGNVTLGDNAGGFGELDIAGGVKLITGAGGALTAKNLTVNQSVTTESASGNMFTGFTTSQVGALTMTGAGQNAALTTTTVTGNVKLSGKLGSFFSATTVTVDGRLTV